MPHPSNTSRRQFLQSTAAAGAFSIISQSSERAFGYRSPNDRPVFATIGLRNQGWAITNKSFRFADFAALADVDANVLGANVEKTKKRQGKKPQRRQKQKAHGPYEDPARPAPQPKSCLR